MLLSPPLVANGASYVRFFVWGTDFGRFTISWFFGGRESKFSKFCFIIGGVKFMYYHRRSQIGVAHMAVSLLLGSRRPPSTQLFSPIENWQENGPITTD